MAVGLGACTQESSNAPTTNASADRSSQSDQSNQASSSPDDISRFDAEAARAADWIVQNLVDGAYAQYEYDGDLWTDAGLTIDSMWALIAAGEIEAAQKTAFWLALRDTAIDYGGDGEQVAKPSAMGKLGLAYITPAVTVVPEYQSVPDLATTIIGRLSPEGRFRDISEWGDNSTPTGQAFDILLLHKLDRLEGLPADPVAGLIAIGCEDGSYP